MTTLRQATLIDQLQGQHVSSLLQHGSPLDVSPSRLIPTFFPAALSEPSVLQFPDSVTSARAVMLFNLASVYCLKGEIEKARKFLQQVSPAHNDYIVTSTSPPMVGLCGEPL